MANTDSAYYECCAIAAMSALIAKMPLKDREHGDDVQPIVDDVARSADDYAVAMLHLKRMRENGAYPYQSTPIINNTEAGLRVDSLLRFIERMMSRLERNEDDYSLAQCSMLSQVRDILIGEDV